MPYTYWVPEGSLAGNCWVGFPLIFGKTWPQSPSRTAGLVLHCRLHHKSAPQTNSKAISRRQTFLARLPSGTQTYRRGGPGPRIASLNKEGTFGKILIMFWAWIVVGPGGFWEGLGSLRHPGGWPWGACREPPGPGP